MPKSRAKDSLMEGAGMLRVTEKHLSERANRPQSGPDKPKAEARGRQSWPGTTDSPSLAPS